MRAGQQGASLLKLAARTTTVLQDKQIPTMCIAIPLISYYYKWLSSLKVGKVNLQVVDGSGEKELVPYSDLEVSVRRTIDLLIIEMARRFPELSGKVPLHLSLAILLDPRVPDRKEETFHNSRLTMLLLRQSGG